MFVLEGEDVSTSSGFMVLKYVFGRQDPSRNRKYSLTLRFVCGGVVRGLETNSAKKQAKHSRGVLTMQSRLWLGGKQELGTKFGKQSNPEA